MGKIIFILALLVFLYFYYGKPVSIEQEKPPVAKTQETPKKKVTPKPVVKEEEPIIEVQEQEVLEQKPLPELSPIIRSTAKHPYADPDKYPLHYAICKGDLEKIKQILKKESLVNEQGEVVLGTKDCYCELDKYKVCSCDATLIMPPLNLALLKRDENTAKYLLRRKANPLLKDAQGRTALDIAQQKNMAEMQDLLKKYIK